MKCVSLVLLLTWKASASVVAQVSRDLQGNQSTSDGGKEWIVKPQANATRTNSTSSNNSNGNSSSVFPDFDLDTQAPSASPTAFCLNPGMECSNATGADPCCGEGRCMFGLNKTHPEISYCRDKCIIRNRRCNVDDEPFRKCCGDMKCVEGRCKKLPVCVRPFGNCTMPEDDPRALPCCWRQECRDNVCQPPLTCRKVGQTCGEPGQMDCCDGRVCFQGVCEVERSCRRLGDWCNVTAAEDSPFACCGRSACVASADGNATCVQTCQRTGQTCEHTRDCCGKRICGTNQTCEEPVSETVAVESNATNTRNATGSNRTQT